MKQQAPGQAMILVAIILMGIAAFGTLLIVNALFWFNTRQATYQAITRAAHDGAAELVWAEGLPLTVITDTRRPELPTATARHCLDIERARQVTLNSLQENLSRASSLYVTDDGAPLQLSQVVTDTAGTYLVDLSVVNPPGLNCPESDPEPTYPAGTTYPYQRPYIHLVVRLPMKAMFGPSIVAPIYQVEVASAVSPAGGAASGED